MEPLMTAQDHEPADPVFVLCAARSGSTLLRFLLDAHPDLACPPETELPSLCLQLAQTWGLLAGTPVEKGRNGEPRRLPEPLRSSVRHAINQLIGQHLARRGKKRLADKSLFTAKHVSLLSQLFPETKFICLYRHPMDMIASGIEACPWGLKGGFGFDSYAASSPGMEVLALARYWADHAREIRQVEERYPKRCFSVRYEDLVHDPETAMDGVFAFLGAAPSPGISTRCFTPERERVGRADYKIWQTSRVSPDSVGRGWSIPPDQIEEPVRERINQLADELGYVRVDATWSAADAPGDLRVGGGASTRTRAASARDTRQMPRGFLTLGDQLQKGLFGVSDRFLRAWGPCAGESFLVVATSPAGDDNVMRWRVNLGARTVTLADTSAADAADAAADGSAGGHAVAWAITGTAAAWENVLGGTVNLNVALRRRELRYADTGTTPRSVTAMRIGMLADLLGITSWRLAEAETPEPPRAPTAA
jgi:hypothetical protein